MQANSFVNEADPNKFPGTKISGAGLLCDYPGGPQGREFLRDAARDQSGGIPLEFPFIPTP